MKKILIVLLLLLGVATSLSAQSDNVLPAVTLGADEATATIPQLSPGRGTAAIQVTGTFDATLKIEGTVDGTNWTTVPGADDITAAGLYSATASGLRGIRVRIDTYVSGSAEVTIGVSSAGGGAGGSGASGAVEIAEGGNTAQVTATAGGSVQVECTSGCGGSGGSSIADDAAVTAGTTSVTLAAGFFDDTSTDSVNENDAGALRMSANRNLYTTIRDAAGNERGALVTANNELLVEIGAGSAAIGTVTVTDGAGALNTIIDSGTITAVTSITNAVTVTDGAGSLNVIVDSGSVTADSELPAAAALADNTANPTAPGVAAFLMCFDGSTWDRCPTGSGGVGASDANTTRIVQAQATIFRSIDLDESEEEVKASAGEVCSVWITNTSTGTRWLKFYNDTAANVTVGTTTPAITIGIPGNSTDDVSGSFSVGGGCLAFSTAISVAATTGVADNDTGAPGANEVIVMIGYR